MHASPAIADEILKRAVKAVPRGVDELRRVLADEPLPIYVTDAEGLVTYFNRACVDFAGLTPQLGQARWCVTWKLYTDDGAFLPHADCPMAVAIKTRRPIRGVTALAERPDGVRVRFMPFPTPVFDEDGELVGAVNVLIDVSDAQQAELLLAQARRCRWLAGTVKDAQTALTLNRMAEEYEQKAFLLGRKA